MTAPDITSQPPAQILTAATGDAITAGWHAYRRIPGITWPQAGTGGARDVCRAAWDLYGALEMHGRENETGYPLPGLLARYREQAAQARERLIGAVREHCGNEDAAYVSGEGGTR
jgi:hypothetical protein